MLTSIVVLDLRREVFHLFSLSMTCFVFNLFCPLHWCETTSNVLRTAVLLSCTLPMALCGSPPFVLSTLNILTTVNQVYLHFILFSQLRLFLLVCAKVARHALDIFEGLFSIIGQFSCSFHFWKMPVALRFSFSFIVLIFCSTSPHCGVSVSLVRRAIVLHHVQLGFHFLCFGNSTSWYAIHVKQCC